MIDFGKNYNQSNQIEAPRGGRANTKGLLEDSDFFEHIKAEIKQIFNEEIQRATLKES